MKLSTIEVRFKSPSHNIWPAVGYHAAPCSTMQHHAVPCSTMQYCAKPCNTMQCHAISCNTMQYYAIPCITMQYYAKTCNTMQYYAISCNTMQYHASLITADGAYYCPVGSIRPFFLIEKNSFLSASLQGAVSSRLGCMDGWDGWDHTSQTVTTTRTPAVLMIDIRDNQQIPKEHDSLYMPSFILDFIFSSWSKDSSVRCLQSHATFATLLLTSAQLQGLQVVFLEN